MNVLGYLTNLGEVRAERACGRQGFQISELSKKQLGTGSYFIKYRMGLGGKETEEVDD